MVYVLFEVILCFITGIHTVPEPNWYFTFTVDSDDYCGCIGLINHKPKTLLHKVQCGVIISVLLVAHLFMHVLQLYCYICCCLHLYAVAGNNVFCGIMSRQWGQSCSVIEWRASARFSVNLNHITAFNELITCSRVCLEKWNTHLASEELYDCLLETAVCCPVLKNLPLNVILN